MVIETTRWTSKESYLTSARRNYISNSVYQNIMKTEPTKITVYPTPPLTKSQYEVVDTIMKWLYDHQYMNGSCHNDFDAAADLVKRMDIK